MLLVRPSPRLGTRPLAPRSRPPAPSPPCRPRPVSRLVSVLRPARRAAHRGSAGSRSRESRSGPVSRCIEHRNHRIRSLPAGGRRGHAGDARPSKPGSMRAQIVAQIRLSCEYARVGSCPHAPCRGCAARATAIIREPPRLGAGCGLRPSCGLVTVSAHTSHTSLAVGERDTRPSGIRDVKIRRYRIRRIRDTSSEVRTGSTR